MLKFLKKNVSHSILTILLVLFILLDIRIPIEVANLVDTLFGRILVVGAALSLFFVRNVLLGVLGIVAAYELLRRSEESAAGGATSVESTENSSENYIPSEKRRQDDFSALNRFPVTLEENVIHNMIPFVSGENLPPASFRPTLDSLYDAAKIE